MAQIDSSIYFQQQPNDFMGSIQKGMSLGDKLRGQQKERNINDAYAESMKINPDGSRSLNREALLGNLLKGGYGSEAGQMSAQWQKDADAKTQQQIENDLRRQQIYSDMNLKKQAFGLDSAKFDFEKQKALIDASKKNTPAALNSSDKQRYDNLNMVVNGIGGMKTALENGDNTFSLIGDNDFTANRNRAVEAFGRMQSGGAIGDEERESFIAMLPTVMDSSEMQKKKMEAIELEMKNRFQTMGLEAPAATPKIPHGTIEDGFIFYGGDAADPKNWKKVK